MSKNPFLIIIFLLAVAAGPEALAYSWGIKGGVNVSQHKVVDSQGNEFGSRSLGLGYAFGFFLDSQSIHWGIESNLLFTERSSVPSTIGTQDYQYSLNSLELPVIGYYRWSPIKFGFGPYLKYGVGKVHIDGGILSPARDYSYGELGLLQYELGVLFALATRFDTGLGYVSLESRFSLGLSNRAKDKVGKTEFSSLAYDMLLGMAF